MAAKQAQAFEKEVAEIGGVQDLQSVLIMGVERATLAVGEGLRLAGRHLVGHKAAVLPAIDLVGERTRRPALVIDVVGLQHLAQQADLVVRVEDREARFEPDEFRMTAQDLGRNRVERAEPRHTLRHGAGKERHALLHFPRRLVSEGDGKDLVGAGTAGRQNVGDARRQHARLAGAGAGQHEDRPFDRFDGGPLFRVEAVEIRTAAGRHRGPGPRGDAVGTRRRGRIVEGEMVVQKRAVLANATRISAPGMWARRGTMSTIPQQKARANPGLRVAI